MKSLTLALCLVFAPLVFADTYDCPADATNPLPAGMSIQGDDQPRCKGASGFSDSLCSQGFTATQYYMPAQNNPAGFTEYGTFFNCADKGSSVKHVLANGKHMLVCRAAKNDDEKSKENPPGCCHPVPSDGAVNVEGTGVLSNGQLVEHDGSVNSAKCPQMFDTALPKSGGSHKCLIPFISVACDTSLYPFGTIFEIPMLEKVQIKMPDGQVFHHPKYVVCEDTGSAIKGAGRFDFYTGSFGWKNPSNPFGSSASNAFKMAGGKSCDPAKTFRVIKHDDPDWAAASRAIAAAISPGSKSANTSSWLTDTSSAAAK